MNGDRLLAKSGQNAPTLLQHSADVVSAFEALFGTGDEPSYLGRQWLRFFRLDADAFSRFYTNGVMSCALHDVGKANDTFQAAIARRRRQFIRHEHLSAFLLNGADFTTWLSNGNIDLDIVISSILGHHLKASWEKPADGAYCGLSNPVIDGESMQVLLDHPDFDAVLRLASDKAHLPDSPRPANDVTVDTWDEERVCACSASLRKRAIRVNRHDNLDLRLLRAVKTALIVADSVGSARLAQSYGSIADWIAERFPRHNNDEKVLNPAAIDRKIIEPRIAEIRRSKPQAAIPDQFQLAAEELGARNGRALLLAPCGAGKTLAAWLWIKGVLRYTTASRAIFLYPTRGTTVEGFRDYVSLAPEADAALLHGAAKYDLRHQLQDIRTDDERPKHYEVDDRLAKLAYWDKRIFSATVHQFLAFMQQDYASMCLLPVLADSVVIVDEVHSFDSRMFAALLSFLREFDVPVLCMTASLNRRRRTALESVGLETYPRKPEQFAVLTCSAEIPRYRVEFAPAANGTPSAARYEVSRRVDAALAAGQRVLWVVNQVARCQNVGQEMAGRYPDLICYHGRFRHQDRARQHGAAIASFADEGPVLAITTQVCEMSLDLDADMLVTELAPIPSLIQRMGRCNRRAQHRGTHENPGSVLIYPPDCPRPYRDDELKIAEEFVARLVAARAVSQQCLEALLEELSPRMPADGAGWVAFIENGFWSAGGESFMEEDGWSVTAVLTEDLSDFRALRAERQPTDGLLLPCPRSLACIAAYETAREYLLPRYVHIACSAHYSERWGLLNEPNARVSDII